MPTENMKMWSSKCFNEFIIVGKQNASPGESEHPREKRKYSDIQSSGVESTDDALVLLLHETPGACLEDRTRIKYPHSSSLCAQDCLESKWRKRRNLLRGRTNVSHPASDPITRDVFRE